MFCKSYTTTFLTSIYLLFSYHVTSSTTTQPTLNGDNTHSSNFHSDFRSLRLHSEFFVDKSSLIRDYMWYSDKIKLITRPRSWGKSVNIDMLYQFLRIETDANGNRLPVKERENPVLFLGGTIDLGMNVTKKLKRLKITKHEDSILYLGHDPVIFISFQDIKGETFSIFENKFKTLIANLFSQYEYLKVNLTGEERTCFESIRNGNSDLDTLIGSVRFLSKLLHEHYEQKVHILFDAYDEPLNYLFRAIGKQRNTKFADITERLALESVFVMKDFKNMYYCLRRILDSFYKDNPHLERGLCTGLVRMKNETLFDNTTETEMCGVLQSCFGGYYGFSEAEVDALLTKADMMDKRKLVKTWYDGYIIGWTHMYNPFSIISFLSTANLQDHWVRVGEDISLIKRLLLNTAVQCDLVNLIGGNGIESVVPKGVSYINQSEPMLIPLMLHSGYLTMVWILDNDSYKLKSPNAEVDSIYNETMTLWTKNNLPTESEYLLHFMYNNLSALNVNGFERALKPYLQSIPDTTFTKYKPSHNVYIGCVYNLMQLFLERYRVKYDEITNEGTADITIVTKRKKMGAVIILRFETVKIHQTEQRDENKEMETLAERALRVIHEKRYLHKAKAKYHYINEALMVGIGFYGKQFVFKSSKITDIPEYLVRSSFVTTIKYTPSENSTAGINH